MSEHASHHTLSVPVLMATPPEGLEQYRDPSNQLVTAKHTLLHMKNEPFARMRHLGEVRVNADGLAECRTGLTTIRVAGVRIDADEKPYLVPFALEQESGTLKMEFDPRVKTDRFGFFVGQQSLLQNEDHNVVIRQGRYPGFPLVVIQTDDDHEKEIMMGLGGFRDPDAEYGEWREKLWADQLDIWSLGFARNKVRGVFNRITTTNPAEGPWHRHMLTYARAGYEDQMLAFDPAEVRPDLIQILTYTYARPMLQPSGSRHSFGSIGFDRDETIVTGGASRALVNTLSSAFQIQMGTQFEQDDMLV